MFKKRHLLCLLFLFIFSNIFAQRTFRYTEANAELKEAIQFIEMHYYQQAHYLLTNYIMQYHLKQNSTQHSDYQMAQYYAQFCALKLNRPFAEENFRTFLAETNSDNLRQLGNYEFAKYYYSRNRFDEAITYYESCNIAMLSNQELANRNFELGYAYLATQRLDKVDVHFQSAKNIPGEYFKPGNYYHGILSYYKKNYTEAINSFNTIKDEAQYKKIVPFYLTEIEYINGDKQKALSLALSYLAKPDALYYQNELNQMVAQIYTEQNDFEKAEKYYTAFIQGAEYVRHDDYFKLAYAQYQQGKIEEAIPNLEIASQGESSVSQQSQYLLANAYLKNGNKGKALTTLTTYSNKINDNLRKALMDFTIAKLQYEAGDDKKALVSLTEFIKDYPESIHIDEANEISALINIKYENFNDALITMNKLKTVSYSLKKLYQQANYARGIQMLRENNPELAIFNFQETSKFIVDTSLVSLSEFWLAECNYRLGRYEQSMTHSNMFLTNPDTLQFVDYTQKIHLTKAYLYFHQGDNANLVSEYILAMDDTSVMADVTSRIGSTKANFVPEKVPLIRNDAYVLSYDLPEEEIAIVYKPIPLKPLAFNTEIRKEDQSNIVRFAVGNLSGINVGVGYNVDQLTNFPLYLEVNHSSTKGKIRFQDVNRTHIGGYSYTQFKEHFIDAAFEIDKNKNLFYGFDATKYNFDGVDIKQVFRNVGITLNATPLTTNKYDVKYKGNLYTGIYSDKFGASEYAFQTQAFFAKQLHDDLEVNSDVLIDLNLYGVKGRTTQTNSLWLWQPSITKQIDQIKLKLGLYPAIGKSLHLLPDLSLTYALDKNKTLATLAYKATMQLNTFRQLSTINPFMFKAYTVQQTKTNELTAALSGNMSSHLSYAIRTGLAVYNNLPFYFSDTAGDYKQFSILYEKRAIAFLFDASLDYILHKNLSTGMRINLRPIIALKSNKEAWHFVPSFLNIYGKIKATKDVILKADLFVVGGSKAFEQSALVANPYVKSLLPGVDMNLAAQYVVNSKWHVTIDVNNLFSSNYQRWYRYPMYGTNVLVGVVHALKHYNIN